MKLPAVGNVPNWAVWIGGAAAAYLLWRAIAEPGKLAAAVGAGAVAAADGAVSGAVKEVGSIFGIQREADMECKSLSMNCTPVGAVKNIWSRITGKDEAAESIRTPQYVPQAGVIQQRNALESFADVAGKGF